MFYMTKQTFIFVVLLVFVQLSGCNNKRDDKPIQCNAEDMRITTETLKQILEAFNRHDLDAIMEYFAEDCSFDFREARNPGASVLLAKEK